MLKIIYDMKQVSFAALMEIYSESNREKASALYSNLSANEGLLLVEDQFYQYLRYDFFSVKGAFYAVWEEQEKWISALRMEPYKDGLLLAGIETHPDHRNKGFAGNLIRQALQTIVPKTKVYSHVHKKNAASLSLHATCGFNKIMDYAVYIDGSVDHHSVTFMLLCQ